MKMLTLISTSIMAASLMSCAVTQATLDPNTERSVTRSFQDITAARAIKARMLRVEGFELDDVSVDVTQGIVLLAGAAPRDVDKIEAERIAWSAPRVTKVGNEIYIGQSNGFLSKTKDELISKSVRTRLATSSNVRNLNYDIETRDGIVYLMGIARNQDELVEAARIVSVTRGVKEVVSYATVKGDIPNAFTGANSPSHVAQSTASLQVPTTQVPSGRTLSSPGDDLGFWGTPVPSSPTTDLSEQYGGQTIIDPTAPLPYRPGIVELDADALESGEPYLRDPLTGERIILPPGVKPIPYVPDSPGSLGAGGAPLPPGAVPSKILGVESTETFAGGASVSLSTPYTMDDQGNQIPVSWDGSQWVAVIK